MWDVRYLQNPFSQDSELNSCELCDLIKMHGTNASSRETFYIMQNPPSFQGNGAAESGGGIAA